MRDLRMSPYIFIKKNVTRCISPTKTPQHARQDFTVSLFNLNLVSPLVRLGWHLSEMQYQQ
jgi:hypothetical protein